MMGCKGWQWLSSLILFGLFFLSSGWEIKLGDGLHPVPLIAWATPMASPYGPSLADQSLLSAQRLVRYLPSAADSYNQLALACLLKSRETGDFSYTTKAELALQRSQVLAPNHPDALKIQVMLFLSYHQFSDALDLIQQLQPRLPQDSQLQAATIDALVELGDYPAAIAATQAMLTQFPSASAYARMSYLRSLQGDVDSAIAQMQRAVQLAQPRDREGLAWYHVQLGQELLNAKRFTEGNTEIDQALAIFPNYHLALVAKARTYLINQDWHQAVSLYQQAEDQMPLPDTAIALGNLYAYLGNPKAARQQYALVDFLVQTGGEVFKQSYAQQLATFWADRDVHLHEALSLIQQEHLTRSDVYTLDVLAWCLFKLNRLPEAKATIEQALRLSTPDARIYYHAGMIDHQSGNDAQAQAYLRQALKLNPVFDVLQAQIAEHTLNSITHTEQNLS
jgi:tetratricopeptide (TPR) repeat protein